MKKVLYFAYGSNMDIGRLIFRVGKLGNVNPGVPHVLNNYKLVFNCGGYANIAPSVGDLVEGILYDLNDEQLKELDFYEGFYYRQHFDLPNGRLALVYVGRNEVVRDRRASRKRPELGYVNIILDSSRQAGFKKTYNDVLNFKLKNYPLKSGSKHKPWL